MFSLGGVDIGRGELMATYLEASDILCLETLPLQNYTPLPDIFVSFCVVETRFKFSSYLSSFLNGTTNPQVEVTSASRNTKCNDEVNLERSMK